MLRGITTKFHQNWPSSFGSTDYTRVVTDGQMDGQKDGQHESYMSPPLGGRHNWAPDRKIFSAHEISCIIFTFYTIAVARKSKQRWTISIIHVVFIHVRCELTEE